MSTVPIRHKFFVYAPDKNDDIGSARRYAVRSRHIEDIKPKIEAGTVFTAGMMVSPESILPEFGDGPKEAKGSMLIVEAENIEEVRKMIEADVYYTSGVWDTEKLAIFPIFLATK